MPGFDGTGPWGEGPMTGGARGLCNTAGAEYRPGYGRGFGRGRGFGYGRGFGRGRGYGYPGAAFYPASNAGFVPAYGAPYQMSASDEINMLKADADAMKRRVDDINRRIGDLQKETAE